MTVAAALFIGAVVVGIWLPARLERLCVSQFDPSVLIIGWLLSIVGVLAASTAGVTLLLVPSHGVPTGLLASLSSCWSSVRHGASPRLEEFSGLMGLLLLLALVARFGLIGCRMARRRARSRRERLAVLRLAARTESGSPSILWLAHDRPLAFSLPGRPSYLVATEGLRRHLTNEQAHAVLEHERAHVRCRHHLLLGVVDTLAAALPFLPLFGSAPVVLRDLVELAADSAAARRCGAEVVRSALIRVVADGAPGASLAFGRDALEARLERLARPPRLTTWVRRGMACGFAGSAPLLPFVTATVFFVGSSTLFCQGF